MKLLPLMVVLFFTINTANADNLSPDERAAASRIRAAIKFQCESDIEAKLKQPRPDDAPAVSRWLSSYLNMSPPSELCSCASDGVERQLTSRILRSGTQQELLGIVKLAGAQCALPKLKVTFPSFCQDMLTEAVGRPLKSIKAQTVASKYCQCVQADIDYYVTAENFEAFTASTLKDFQAFRATGQVPTDSTSLLGSMERCGGEALGKELSDDI